MLPEEAARFRIVHAIRDALPTRLHAEMLFEQVADLMGSAAWVERALFGEWRRLASIKGIANWHIFRPEADGWTLFGNDLFGRFGPDWMRRAVKDADAEFGIDPPPPPPWPDDAPPLRVAVRTYRIAQAGRPEHSTLVPEDSWAHELQPWDLDNDVAGAVVTRMRWLKE